MLKVLHNYFLFPYVFVRFVVGHSESRMDRDMKYEQKLTHFVHNFQRTPVCPMSQVKDCEQKAGRNG